MHWLITEHAGVYWDWLSAFLPGLASASMGLGAVVMWAKPNARRLALLMACSSICLGFITMIGVPPVPVRLLYTLCVAAVPFGIFDAAFGRERRVAKEFHAQEKAATDAAKKGVTV